MEKLEFHKDKNFFMDWLNMNAMSTGEIALWHTLMNVGNRLGQRSKFNAPTSTLSKYTGLSKQGLINARKRLMERGFIKFEKGTKYQAPVYQMLPGMGSGTSNKIMSISILRCARTHRISTALFK